MQTENELATQKKKQTDDVHSQHKHKQKLHTLTI